MTIFSPSPQATRMGRKLTADEKLQFQSQLTSRLRNNGVGVALALLIGGLGAHKFYLNSRAKRRWHRLPAVWHRWLDNYRPWHHRHRAVHG